MTSPVQTFIGFDSAWTDNVKAPGAICAVQLDGGRQSAFFPPRLVRFSDALSFIDEVSAGSSYTLIALDQPTIVPNASGMRPVERVAGSVVSWIGGGVQPANRGKIGMFCEQSPIWPFLSQLGAVQNPIEARVSSSGRYLVEVFPALALASFNVKFGTRLGAPKYNPANSRRFDQRHWTEVCQTAASQFTRRSLTQAAEWCQAMSLIPRPTKADQDRLDAALCTVIALHWRFANAEQSVMIGDLQSGYMVAPASPPIRARLTQSAARLRILIDHQASDQDGCRQTK